MCPRGSGIMVLKQETDPRKNQFMLPRNHPEPVSLSLVPPSAKFDGHPHGGFVDDVPVYGWVKTVPVISLIFSSAITPGIPCHCRQPPSMGGSRPSR